MLKRLLGLIIIWLHRFWLPLSITVGMLVVAFSFMMVLLVKQQITVQIDNIPIRNSIGVLQPAQGVLKKGEHLNILQKKDDWYQVRRENESTGWVASWLLERKTPVKHMGTLAEATIVLDPGHGGSDSGALSTDENHFEKTYTLRLARQVRDVLENDYGAHVVMTRNSDKIVYLSQIPKLAEDNHGDAFISFHFDSAPDANVASGFTAYYYHTKNDSKLLATDVNDAMDPVMPLQNKGVEFGDFLVIRDTTVPSILLENGYINDDNDFAYIRSTKYQKTIADSIPKGLQNYFTQVAKENN
ncbi:MAG: N-acetylmuramoyl-L-alanine amidase [Lactobacillaceae bacterium]|jgi:N-acetylmuramoyl-L-alanine amidase|nr:N-acetylmuramoyl-L-alanine amidase [Lactobacillaceae bacterium]